MQIFPCRSGQLALSLLFAFQLSGANIVQNPSFEAGGNCSGTSGTCGGQSPWVFTPAASGSLFGVGSAYVAQGGGTRAAWFGGNSLYDTISQTLTTSSGQSYLLTFTLDTATGGGHATGSFRVLWNGVVQYQVGPGTDPSRQFPNTQITIASLIGTGSDVLAFQGYNFAGNDRVDLVTIEGVPEPATWLLTSLAGATLLIIRRRCLRLHS